MNNREYIMDTCGIKADELVELVFEAGCEYVAKHFALKDTGRLNRYFWSWWENAWAKVDEQFVDSICYEPIINGFVITVPGYSHSIPVKSAEQMKHHYIRFHSLQHSAYYMDQTVMRESGLYGALKKKSLKPF